MNLALIDFILILTTIAGTVSAFSVLYAKFIRPIKKVVKQVEDNTEAIKKLEESKVIKQIEENARAIKALEDKISKVKSDSADESEFSSEVRAILLESFIAVLDGLEQNGANHLVTQQKVKLIKFMSQQIGSKKKK